MALIKPEQLRSGSYTISGSFSGSFQGNGSGLTNLPTQSFNTGSFVLTSSFNAFTSSYIQDSASFDTRIISNSSSINTLSGSFDSFTQTYNTGSFTGSFIGSLLGTASFAQTASFSISSSQAQNTISASFAQTASFVNVAGLGGFVQNGNSFGTTAILGTNDNQSLALETSGSTRMFISSSGNIGIRTTTPDSQFQVSSSSALSTHNVARIGTLRVNGAGDVYNNGIGAVGTNTFFGENVARNTKDRFNTFIGNTAGEHHVNGDSNVFLGMGAGRLTLSDTNITDASGSVFLGRDTRAASNNQINQIVIGDRAIGLGSNTVVLGNTSIVTTALRGNVGIGTTTPTSASLTVNGNVWALSFTGSLQGTSSFAISSSNATTASFYQETDPIFVAKSGSFATTGSNQFNGNQTITGSLIHGLEGNIATGENSHAEGSITKAIGNYSHAEGDFTQAKGDYSHAEGQETIASGSYSHAEGYGTIALGDRQHVTGQYNFVSPVQSAFIVGNGTDDGNRSNLIYAAGNEVQISGSLIATSFTGSLQGTSSFAISSSNAITASFVAIAQTASFVTASSVFGPFGSNSVTSASFAISSSQAQNAQTASFTISASWAENASTASYVTPLYQDVLINGNLNVTSSFTASGLNYPAIDNGEESFIQTDGNGNLSLQYVKTIYEEIVNGEATNLIKGTPVYASGSQGAASIVYRADAGDPTKMPVIYVAADTLAPTEAGRGIALGLIKGVDTTGFPAGTEIYVAPGGGFTSIRPTGSAIVQVLGYVTKEGNGGQGVILNPGPNSLPNLSSGSVWVGNADSIPVAVLTSSLSVASSSFAQTASYALNVTTIDTSSFVTTSSFNTFTSSYTTGSFTGSFTGSLFGTASWAINAQTASFAISASFAQTSATASVLSGFDPNAATFTIELIDALTVDFYAPDDLRINTTSSISGSVTASLSVNNSAYTLTNLINQGNKITVTAASASVFNLNARYE
jgi:hypothetical protein